MFPSATGVVWSPDGSRCCVGVVIRDSAARCEYRFGLEVPAGTTVEERDDGGLRVVGGDGVVLASVAAPWAYDAMGRPLPAFQSWDGDDVVVRVDHRGATYPVLADPEFDWGWVSGTLYFNREETRNARDAVALAGLVAGACSHPACRVIAPIAGVLALAAARIYEDGKCLKIKIQPRPGFPPSYIAVPRTTPRGGRNCH